MGISRNVSLMTALRYKGQGPMLTFILHRIGGMGMAIFISMHLLASAFGGDIGNFINDIYMSWVFQIIIFFFVMFHAINGLRITILDLWPKLLEYQREATWVQWVVFIALYGFAVFSILTSTFGGQA
jgi:succinate dehydrogenase / fumarate reductase cytochrome b subunit